MAVSHARVRRSPRVGELVDGALGELLVTFGMTDGDETGLVQPVDRPIQVRPLPYIHHLVLAPQLDEALDPVGMQRPDLEQAQHRQCQRRRAGQGAHSLSLLSPIDWY